MIRRNRFLVVFVMLALLWSLTPIYWFCRMAFLTPLEIRRFPWPLLPHVPNLAAFYNIFGFNYILPTGVISPASGQAEQIIRGLINSIMVSVIVTLITLVIVLPLAYVFARTNFRFKNALLFAILLGAALPPISTLIPFYVMYLRLGLAGTLTGLVIVYLTITVPFVTWMLIGYFRNLPPIERLARIDGYSRLAAFIGLVLPLARSGIAVAAVTTFLFAWNEYTYALVLVNGSTANTLPTAVSGFLFMYPEPGNLAASVVLTIVPPILVAYFLQRHVGDMNLVDAVR
jgi:multiple sugar transport system permease protein